MGHVEAGNTTSKLWSPTGNEPPYRASTGSVAPLLVVDGWMDGHQFISVFRVERSGHQGGSGYVWVDWRFKQVSEWAM
jgi:hypothetical protein